MCTLTLAIRHNSIPLVVAANRDERTDRPSSGPILSGRIFAPRDKVRGGTWIGVNTDGLFVAITNRDSVDHKSCGVSRGTLVHDMLMRDRASDVSDVLDSIRCQWTNGFHLVVVDRNESFLAVSNGNDTKVSHLNDGIHVITSYGFTPDHCPRASFVRGMVEGLVDGYVPGLTEYKFGQIMSDHGDGTAQGSTCVHHPDETHKTRSSMVISVSDKWTNFRILNSDEPPCAGRWRMVDVPISEKS